MTRKPRGLVHTIESWDSGLDQVEKVIRMLHEILGSAGDASVPVGRLKRTLVPIGRLCPPPLCPGMCDDDAAFPRQIPVKCLAQWLALALKLAEQVRLAIGDGKALRPVRSKKRR